MTTTYTVHYGPGDRPLCGAESWLAVYTDNPHEVSGCDDCLELVAEDLGDLNLNSGRCLHCKELISAVGGVAWSAGRVRTGGGTDGSGQVFHLDRGCSCP